VKKALVSLDAGEVEIARQSTQEAIIALDKAAQKGVIHKNNAARRKSRLMKRLNAIESETNK
jgi:small subunit ribosomal protein S20